MPIWWPSWRRLSGLSGQQRLLLLWAAVWLLAARLALWLCPFGPVWRLTRWLARRPGRRGEGGPSVDEVVWAIGAVGRRLPGASCLPRALATYGLLTRQGLGCVLRLGVARTPEGRLRAHAWVELDDKPLPPGEDLSAFTPLPGLDGDRP